MPAPDDVVIVSVARTPFGRYEGCLSRLEGTKLAALAMDEAVRRSQVEAASIDAVYGGVGMIGSAVLTPVRQALLCTNLPSSIPSAAIDRACCSGMTAIGIGFKDLRLNEARAVLCGGFDSLSRTPLLAPRQRPRRVGNVTMEDPLLLRSAHLQESIAVYSGEEALRHGVDRTQQDCWAHQSHQRALDARVTGYFDFECFMVDTPDSASGRVSVRLDESPRADTTLEKLASLKPVYNGKTITPGNAPGLSDGAAFLVLCRTDFAHERGFEPLARIVDYVQVSGHAHSGTSTPAMAIQKLARRQGRAATGWDLIEINEAFAATPLVSTLVLADGDAAVANSLRQRTNVCGGAVALGHPLGASGARIVMTLVNGLRRRGGGVGVAAICGGFGQGDGLMLEVDP